MPTFVKMREEVTAKRDDLIEADRTFEQEISFLMHVAEPTVMQDVRQKILDAFPSQDEEKDMKACLKVVNDIRGTPQVLCCDPAFIREMTSISHFVGQLVEDECPASALSPATSSFFGQMLERSEWFAKMVFTEKATDFFNRTKIVRGKMAVVAMYREFNDKQDEVDKAVICSLRTFQWMLTTAERKAVNDFSSRKIIEARNVFMTQKAITAGAASGAIASGSSAASSSTSMVKATPAMNLAASKRKLCELSGEAEKSKTVSMAKLKSIFRGRASNNN